MMIAAAAQPSVRYTRIRYTMPMSETRMFRPKNWVTNRARREGESIDLLACWNMSVSGT